MDNLPQKQNLISKALKDADAKLVRLQKAKENLNNASEKAECNVDSATTEFVNAIQQEGMKLKLKIQECKESQMPELIDMCEKVEKYRKGLVDINKLISQVLTEETNDNIVMQYLTTSYQEYDSWTESIGSLRIQIPIFGKGSTAQVDQLPGKIDDQLHFVNGINIIDFSQLGAIEEMEDEPSRNTDNKCTKNCLPIFKNTALFVITLLIAFYLSCGSNFDVLLAMSMDKPISINVWSSKPERMETSRFVGKTNAPSKSTETPTSISMETPSSKNLEIPKHGSMEASSPRNKGSSPTMHTEISPSITKEISSPVSMKTSLHTYHVSYVYEIVSNYIDTYYVLRDISEFKPNTFQVDVMQVNGTIKKNYPLEELPIDYEHTICMNVGGSDFLVFVRWKKLGISYLLYLFDAKEGKLVDKLIRKLNVDYTLHYRKSPYDLSVVLTLGICQISSIRFIVMVDRHPRLVHQYEIKDMKLVRRKHVLLDTDPNLIVYQMGTIFNDDLCQILLLTHLYKYASETGYTEDIEMSMLTAIECTTGAHVWTKNINEYQGKKITITTLVRVPNHRYVYMIDMNNYMVLKLGADGQILGIEYKFANKFFHFAAIPSQNSTAVTENTPKKVRVNFTHSKR